ncbi:transposase, partial [Thiolapillus sp.]|uniref:transposase n=1 Tax=Thiolapillus sp. TaxID=2017437 RepID=UPI003AF47531
FGPVVASVFYSMIGNGENYRRGRDVSAAVGLVPKQHSSGGQACRYLVIDFGTSKSPKSTRQRDNHYCPGRPASVPLRHTFVNSALATQHSLK